MKTTPATGAKTRPHYFQKTTRLDRLLDEALEESFPASDPIATRITRLGNPGKKTPVKKNLARK